MTLEYGFYMPVRVVLGRETVHRLAGEAKRRGARSVLVVTGRTALAAAGITRTILAGLEREGIRTVLFDMVRSDPDTTLVNEGVRLAARNACDLVVAAGGGSALDCGKAVAALATADDFSSSAEFLEIDGHRRIERTGLPVLTVPTLPGTGAEVTMNAVLVNPMTRAKRSIRHPALFPELCIADPMLSLSAPRITKVAAGIDAFCHLMEGYISSRATPFTDMAAREGLEILARALPRYAENADPALHEAVHRASILGGMVIANGGLTLAHGIGSVAGPHYGIPHGIACAAALAPVLRFVLPAVPAEKRVFLSGLFGKDVPGRIAGLTAELGLPAGLREAGVPADAVGTLLRKGMNTSSARGTPREPDFEELAGLLG